MDEWTRHVRTATGGYCSLTGKGEASIQASADAAKGGPQGPQDVCVCGGGEGD